MTKLTLEEYKWYCLLLQSRTWLKDFFANAMLLPPGDWFEKFHFFLNTTIFNLNCLSSITFLPGTTCKFFLQCILFSKFTRSLQWAFVTSHSLACVPSVALSSFILSTWLFFIKCSIIQHQFLNYHMILKIIFKLGKA